MELLNKEHTDLSNEFSLLTSVVSQFIWAGQIGAEMICDCLEKEGVKGTLWQESKHYANIAKKNINLAVTALEAGFNSIIFEPVYDTQKEEASRIDALMVNCNNLLRLAILYYTRPNTIETKKSMIKAWENFKADPKYDVSDLMKLLNL